ncbi:MAG TPA: type II toxin-antitoxin system VapC family toxin [Mycobacterium sp.]|nr:type II toxin-antitoxin system VapC family toxin [Mycobacterium sp.]HUH71955.1 type II toxin-antitoxin system VapC family toxin [Mycobacterium sp.]
MIVVDASAALSALVNDGPARQLLGEERLCCPHLVDSELANGLRRAVQTKQFAADAAWAALDAWRGLAVRRFPVHVLMDRVWQLRDNLTAYDASYVALAESLECTLVTADARLSRTTGAQCLITVVPR